MKTFTLVCFLVLAAFASARPQEKYTDRYDNIDVQEILANRRLLIPYIKCLLDEGKCTAEGKELKSHIKEALENYCEKCTEVQRRETRRVIGHLINKEGDYWNQIVGKYDPQRKYVTKYESELMTVAGSA